MSLDSRSEFVDEQQLLERASTNIDQNDWPIFDLKRVIVYGKGGPQMPRNLLNAELQGPFTIRGTLRSNDETRQLFLPLASHSKCQSDEPRNGEGPRYQVQLNNVTSYSIGDGPVTIWAAGQAGWFRLVAPASSYSSIYDEMKEAVDLFYFLCDCHDQPPRGKHMSFAYLAQQYRQHTPDNLADGQFMGLLRRHAIFLRSQMVKEGKKWMLVYKWLMENCPEARARRKSTTMVKKEAELPSISAQACSSRPATIKQEIPVPQTPSRKRKALANHDAQLHDELSQSSARVRSHSKSGKGAGKKSQLRPLPSAAPRFDTNLKDDNEDDNAEPANAPAPALELKEQDDDPADELATWHTFTAVTDYLPNTVPHGPRDTWVCEDNSCAHEIIHADTSKGQALLNQHIKEHVDFAAMVAIVRKEAARNSITVDFLLEKVRAAAEVARAGGEKGEVGLERRYVNGRLVPLPLKRKLPVW